MTNANSFRSAIYALLLFGVIYFAAVGIYEVRKLIKKHRKKKEDDTL